MPEPKKSYRWIPALLTAVLFPALVLHTTCVAVLGPGTWGAGVVELEPELQAPTDKARSYQEEFENAASEPAETEKPELETPGRVVWTSVRGDRTAYHVMPQEGTDGPTQIVLRDTAGTREIPLPAGFVATRPQLFGSQLVCERWLPWAVPAGEKVARYVASWTDPTLRPEVAIYAFDEAKSSWDYVIPGHTLTTAPDGRRASLLRSGALLAGYYSLHIWSRDSGDAEALFSLREAGELGTGSFTFRWSSDSNALHIGGHTAGLQRRSSQKTLEKDAIALNLLYVADEDQVYDLDLRN